MTTAAAIALTLADLDRRIADLRAAREVLAGLLAEGDPGKADPPGEPSPPAGTEPAPPVPGDRLPLRRGPIARFLAAGQRSLTEISAGTGIAMGSAAAALSGHPWFARPSRGRYELTDAGRSACGGSGATPPPANGTPRSPPPIG